MGNVSSAAFFTACEQGDLEALRVLLNLEPDLARTRRDDGATGLHIAARHADAVRLLLDRGADPNARDVGDNALALHFAAGSGYLESVRALLDAGADVHGTGDLHELDVIGWATVFDEPHRQVVDLLLDRGARHHVFSALALGDHELLRRVITDDPAALTRRLSRFEQQQTALHYVIAPPDGLLGGTFRTGGHYRMLDVLLELGADLEARDAKGRTPLAVAMLRGDREAMRRLHAAGAREPEPPGGTSADPSPTDGVFGGVRPMLGVPDVDAAVRWYQAIGFTLGGSHMDGNGMTWASVQLGDAEIMFARARATTAGASLWITTNCLDALYAHLARRQFAWAHAVLTGETPDTPEVRFTGDLHTAFYGQREFCIRDPNGVELYFCQPVHAPEPEGLS